MKAIKNFTPFRKRNVAEEVKPAAKTLADFMKEAARGKFEIQGTQPVNNAPAIELPTQVASNEIIEHIVPVEPQAPVAEVADKVETITPPVGEPIVSVSRMRVAAMPQFWSHFRNNIHRKETVVVSPENFKDRSTLSVARGWHPCTMDGMDGILHVTKGHTSAVFFSEENGFCGISSSGSRFAGHGVISIDADRAKAYLNGH